MSRGPVLRIVASCQDCECIKVTPYRVQGDSGRDVECAHPDATSDGSPRYIGESRVDATPQWCPLLKSALIEFTRGNPQHKVNGGGS